MTFKNGVKDPGANASRSDGGTPMSNPSKTIVCRALAALGITLAAVALAPDASAACCVAYDYGHENQIHTTTRNEVKNHFTTELTRVENSVVEALRNFSGQQTVNSRAQTNAVANMNDLVDQRTVQLRVQDRRYERLQSAASGASVCNVITGNVAGGTMFGSVPQWRDQLTQVTLDYLLGASDKTASRNGASAAVTERALSVCAANATQDMVDAGLCSVTTQDDGKISDALNANVLLGQSVLNSGARDAARIYVANAYVPAPLGAVPRGVAQNEAGHRLMAQRHTVAARQSHALTVVSDFFADRVPMPNQDAAVASGGSVTTGLRQWAEGTARQTLTYNTEGNNFPDGVSRAAWLELRAKAWFMNANWAMRVDTQTVDSTAKDLAMMGAFSTYMGWEQYRQLERMNMSLAMIVSMLEEQGRQRQE